MRHTLAFALFAASFFCTIQSSSQVTPLASTPPMGWNSWDSYGRTINEQQVRQIADKMAKDLKRFGWEYLVIDEGWYIPNPESDPKTYKFTLDESGRFIPAVNRFPSAANGAALKPLADYVHSKGLKFGLHIIRGIPREAVLKNLPIAGTNFRAADAAEETDTCPWNAYNYGVKSNAAGQAYYDSIVKLYAGWGVDFIKADCIADHPYKPEEIRMISEAIQKSGRPMVLSLSPGPTALEHAEEVAKYSQMWRICDDFWDHWGLWAGHEWSQNLRDQFVTMAKWTPNIKAGAWPDGDMLPLGRLGPNPGAGEVRNTRLTADEQRTMMTLWSIFRSPLIMGGDLLSLDEWTTSLLTNKEVLTVNQHSKESRQVISASGKVVWTARPEKGGGYYVAAFNVSDAEQELVYPWKDLGLDARAYKVRDLWERKDLGKQTELRVKLKPHASVMWVVK